MKPRARAVAVAAALVVASVTGSVADDAGRALYLERCAPCHGDEGAGDGPAAAALEPRPRNFRAPDFWRDRTSAQLAGIVRKGKPGTMMTPFEGVLTDAQITDVVGYLEHFRPAAAPAH